MFTILSAVSLVTCMGLVAVAVRSEFVHDEVRWRHLDAVGEGYTKLRVLSDGAMLLVEIGRVRLSHGDAVVLRDRLEREGNEWSAVSQGRSVPWGRLWFGYRSAAEDGLSLAHDWNTLAASGWGWLLCVPSWLPAALCAILPAFWAWRYRRDPMDRRRDASRCRRCRYDLGGQDRTICPRCGTPVGAHMVRRPVSRLAVISAVSLMFGLMLGGLWVAEASSEGRWIPGLWYCGGGGRFGCGIQKAHLWVEIVEPTPAVNLADRSFTLLGVEFSRGQEKTGGAVLAGSKVLTTLVIPCWLPCAIAGVLPALWLRRCWRGPRARESAAPPDSRRRERAPHCQTCGYGLAGVNGPICPKCGTLVAGNAVRRPVTLAGLLLGASLAGCVAMAAVWAYGSVWGGPWYWGDNLHCGVTGGDIWIEMWGPAPPVNMADSSFTFLGVEYSRGQDKTGGAVLAGARVKTALSIPCWLPCATAAILPAVWLRRRQRERGAVRRGVLCPICDYDLTGNVSGICPECGTPLSGYLIWRAKYELVASAGEPPRCGKCHYNLRGNVSGVCPECGRPIRAELENGDMSES